MVELLQRATPMKVLQVKDRMKVEPNRVYVIPPNKDLSILHGVLHLLAPTAPRGLRLPIDFFFRSLAADQRNRSIGVILSGMGSDGTLGSRGHQGARRERCSCRTRPRPSSTPCPGARSTPGSPTSWRPPRSWPTRIVAYIGARSAVSEPDPALASKTQSAIEKICVLLRSQTGHDFSLYKRSTVYRRIERRMGLHQIDGLAGYVRYLQESPQETQLLFKELLIGVTSFFRDPAAWEQLQNEGDPGAAGGARRGRGAAGLGAGLLDRGGGLLPGHRLQGGAGASAADPSFSLQIFATDLDQDAIERARQGRLSAEHRGRRLAGAAATVLRADGAGLPGAPGDPRDGGLRPAERHHGSAVHQARHPQLPQPAHLPGARAAEEAPAALSLQPQPRRDPLPGERGDDRRRRRSLRPDRRQGANLPSARDAPRSPSRSSSPPRSTPAPARGEHGRRPRMRRPPTCRCWPTGSCWSATRRPPC